MVQGQLEDTPAWFADATIGRSDDRFEKWAQLPSIHQLLDILIVGSV